MESTSFTPLTPNTLSPLTSSETISSADQSPVPRGILKRDSRDSSITPTTSEKPPSQSQRTASVHFSLEQPSYIENTPLASRAIQAIPPLDEKEHLAFLKSSLIFPNKFSLIRAQKKSSQIQEWSHQTLTSREEEFEEAKRTLDQIKAIPLDAATIEELSKILPLLQGRVKRAADYDTWVTFRDKIMRGNSKIEQIIQEGGRRISPDWSFKELQEDWKNAKEESWTKPSVEYNTFKEKVFPILEEHQRRQQAVAQQASNERTVAQQAVAQQAVAQQAANERTVAQQAVTLHAGATTAFPSNDYEPETVSLPFMRGSVDRNLYDIGNVERHEDGAYTIIDMTGRRFYYPGWDADEPRRPDNDCTIS